MTTSLVLVELTDLALIHFGFSASKGSWKLCIGRFPNADICKDALVRPGPNCDVLPLTCHLNEALRSSNDIPFFESNSFLPSRRAPIDQPWRARFHGTDPGI